MDNYKVLFGERIKFLRRRRKLTQESFAELVNRSKNHISKIEQGEVNPPLNLIFDIARVLNVSPAELFNFENVPNSVKNIDYKKELDSITDKTMIKKLFNIYSIIS